jgi:signal transduction histidine kinase
MAEELEKLRRLAVVDPRAARELFVLLLDGPAAQLEQLLQRLSAPGEGRLRQLVANAIRPRPDKAKVVPFLIRWAQAETDEFARTAISASLDGVDYARHQESPRADSPADPLERLVGVVATHRYVAERLCHRVRNALPASSMQVRRIESLTETAPEPLRGELIDTVGRLKDALRSLSRVVEFHTGDEYFEWKSVPLCAWLDSFTKAYCIKNETVSLTVSGPQTHPAATIRANDYLLETVFWNLWKNAAQASTGRCDVAVEAEALDGRLHLTVADGGDGIPEDLTGVVFEEAYSTNGQGRGRGLLEVMDAVRRLSGSANLVRRPAGGCAIRLSFPLEQR